MAKARAVVQVGDKRFEMQQFELPRIGAEDALMRVEACGICGSDVDQFDGKLNRIIVLAGVKGPNTAIQGLMNDRIFTKELTIKGVKNADFDSFAAAVRLIESRKYSFEKMHTHSFALDDVELAIRTLAGRVPGENAVSVSLDPSL